MDAGRSKRRDVRARYKIFALPVSPTRPAFSTSMPNRLRMSGSDIRSPAAASNSSMLGGGGAGVSGFALPFAFAFFTARSAFFLFRSASRHNFSNDELVGMTFQLSVVS